MEVLSNWLARLIVNQVSSEHVGSNPTTSTNTVDNSRTLDCLLRCSFRLDDELNLNRCLISGKITMVVYPLWMREVAGSSPASQTKTAL